MKLFSQDISILREIQSDGSLSLAALSERCAMSQSTVWRKVQEMERAGVIKARVALLDPAQVNAKLCILASISLHDHTEEAIDAFGSLVANHAEIQECHKVSGDADYIVKIRCADVEAYEQFMSHTLLRKPYIRSVISSFVLKEIKSTTALPL